METTKPQHIMRILLYSGTLIQSLYIILTPFNELHSFILISSPFFLTAAYMDIYMMREQRKFKYNNNRTDDSKIWAKRKLMLQKYYTDDDNIDNSFSKCLNEIQKVNGHNVRINRILNNYQSSNKKFKIKMKRNPENSLDQNLQK